MTDESEQSIPKRPARRGKAVSWRRDTVILERMQIVDRLHLLGKPNTAIALELDPPVDEATVRNDLKRISELYRERVGDAHDVLLADAIRRLENVMRLGIEAYVWDKDCEDAVLFGGDQIDAAEGSPKRTVYRDQKGSAQFRGNKAAALAVVERAAMGIAKLQGLVVDKVAPSNPDGSPLDLAALILKARDADSNA